ncbi:hypothetical protein SLEP1_g50447 [Rubroshorea leprosula]|uniref:Uncharacterized protein n=1 Tax=Rubroshorea leprosula TaxID=152421 RepID=A0AAV5M2E3_9ROSI|nr:hypothetical protein SLEP1_g50447 [Rubroshorea leprosula]
MANLSCLVQRPGETSEAFLAKFWKARLKCRVALPEQEFVKLAQKGLDIELRKKFEGIKFRDFFELSYKVAHYENLLREDTQRKSASHGTYYGDANFDLDMAEVVADKPVVCPDLVKVAQNLVEHRLPIREDFKPFKQPPRRMSLEVTLKVKEEIEWLWKVGFIRTSKYVEWLSNVVPVVKKNGKFRICVDFKNLNLTTPKDKYPMPIADLLVDSAARHRILSFMDGHSGYNQIFIVEEDIPKAAFRCPGAIGTYEWVVMPFGLKNVGATYQRAMNAIFHDMISRFMEIYIDDMVVKSNEVEEHLGHLKLAFERMRKYGLKMNPLKCAFDVSVGNFMGYLVHERGLEVGQNKARAVIEAQPPRSKKELQRFLGQLDFNCTNNQAEYEVLIIGLEVLVELKWEEAKPMKKVDQIDITKFLKEEIIHRFGLPETVTLDQGTVFVGAQVEAFAKEMGFMLLISIPHYAQANGQAEVSNKIMINLLEKMVDDNPRRWHELLFDTIWAYRTSQKSSTKVTPFSLTYGHDVVLPMELSARSLRIAIQCGLTFGEYNEAMILELEDLEGMRLTASNRLQTQKLKVAQAYNKRVKSRSLAEGHLVWKVILPPGKKDPRFGKWSPNWEGPFCIHEVLRGGAYWLESLN